MVRSAIASVNWSNTRTGGIRSSAPTAARSAALFGQPSRGATSRRSVSPQFSMARAAAPIFSPSCGVTRMMAGAASAAVGSVATRLEELPGDGVIQRLVGGVDDVGADADRAPALAGLVGAFDHDAGDGFGAGLRRQDADLEIHQPHVLEL